MDPRTSAFWARRPISTLFVLLTLSVGIMIGTVISYGVRGQEKKVDTTDATPLQIPSPKQLSNQFTQIAKQIEPSVVNINVESTVKNPHGRRMRPPADNQDDQDQNPAPGGQGQSPFDDFFDRFFGGQGGQNMPDVRQRSLGSGVIVDPKGYILTNRHVVEGADRIRVKLMEDPDGSVGHDAKLIGMDEETDLAVIKVDLNKPLPAAKLGNSDGPQVGDWVLAIGSPFSLNETVTAGIISAKGRNIVPGARGQFQSFIQTDAAINPGNSGGPLVDMNGEVIGINTAIITGGEGYEGVGFALPTNTVIPVYNQLIGPDHKVTRGSIGVEFTAQANPAVARVYGVSSGVTIANVINGSPADQAGLKVGDTIVSVDGSAVKNGDELVNNIAVRKPGSKVNLGFIRNGKQMSLPVTIADRTKLFAATQGGEEGNDNENKPQESKFGASVQAITSDLADRLNIPAGKGVIVSEVKPGSFAEDVGLSRGDVILEVNKQPVNNEADFNRIQAQLKSGQDVVFLVRQGRGRTAGTIFLGGTLP